MSRTPDLGSEFRRWIRDVPDAPDALLTETIHRTGRTRQRRRRLWFLPGARPPDRMADDAGTGATPIALATGMRGHAATGRTVTMLTPTKLVGFAAGAALAAMLVLAVPQDIATKPEPAGAEAGTASGATPISGEMTVLSQDEQGIRTDDEYGRLYTGEVWTSLFDVDDPRLTGKSRSRHNRHTLPGTPYGPRTMTMWLENEGGSWVGDGRAYQDPLTTALHYQILLEGRGGYEGLDAIIALDQPGFSLRFDVTGAIIPGGLPEAADPPPMELEVAEPS